MILRRGICVVLLVSSSMAHAADYRSAYAGEEKRSIKSLSEDDIKQLQQGRGWGLAKAAELNGMPGPVHILQMKQEISLTAVQEKRIRALFDTMKADAVPLGKKLVHLERQLNNAFANKTITRHKLKSLLDEIAGTRSRLRYVHLSAHLATPAILTARQLSDYNQLRGYGHGDPCEQVPSGHDARMWKKHNGCE